MLPNKEINSGSPRLNASQPRDDNSCKYNGFTLLEILIALFIFTIISIMMVSGLHNVLTTQSATEKNTQRFNQLQLAMLLISHDFEQTINRPIKNANNIQENAFQGENSSVTFTHGGVFNPLGDLNRSTLQRTHYFLKDGNLIRETWPVLDPTNTTYSKQQIILNKVSDLQFKYLDEKGKFQTNWPLSGQNTLPKAIQVQFSLEKLGKMHALYLISGAPHEN